MLCSGATWHAAGLVTRFAGSPKLKKVHVRALELMEDLHNEHDVSLHLPGSIRIIKRGDNDRYLEMKHHYEMAKLYDLPGLETKLLSPEEIAELHPLVDVSSVECGLYTPQDGDVDPTTLTNCIARLAKKEGAVYKLNTRVTDVERKGESGFLLSTAEGEQLECDLLVNAAGLWSTGVSKMLNVNHPAVVIEHQYVITESIPLVTKMNGRLPVLRDLHGSTYIRQERTGLLFGPYEKECVVHDEWLEGPPHEWDMQLFDPAVDRLMDCLESAMELVPAVEEVGIQNVTNGPTIWTGDSLARVGGTRIPGYFEFNSLTYGIAQSLALSEYLTGIMLDGEQPFDATGEFFPARYGEWTNLDYVSEKVKDTYARNNAAVFPFENRMAGRDKLLRTPLYDTLQPLRPIWGMGNGGAESPLYYMTEEFSAKMAEMKGGNSLPSHEQFHNHDWAPLVENEAHKVAGGVGISHSSFSKLEIHGERAHEFLGKIGTNAPPKKLNRTRLTYLTTPSGRVVSEFSVCREKEDLFYMVGSRDYIEFDKYWIELQARELGFTEIDVVDRSSDIEILHIAGPKTSLLMSKIAPEAEEIPFLGMKELEIFGLPAKVFRVSFTGLAGFELHMSSKQAALLFKQILESPAAKELELIPFGSMAVNSLRTEVGFKLRGDLDYVHYSEAGIEPFIGKKNKFLGRDEKYVPQKRAVIFRVHAGTGWEWSIPSDCPILSNDHPGKIIGYTTTSAKGQRTGETFAMGYLLLEDGASPESVLNSLGDNLYVLAYGNEWKVEVLSQPPVLASESRKAGVVASVAVEEKDAKTAYIPGQP
eukprot:CAMPEP_0167740864 /NCGR_PEP_ID=MMETSP0110_2-20121227/532_1 /TAXON_ID=629695 /ORGANISM="Gymnochlora sp., Strain CCMP2014" /LENGTH=815 /DNA_ID=CAMNT_0007624841 /DNA_START=154 /DNA_END=2601 /DNA_ORIENTATION=-